MGGSRILTFRGVSVGYVAVLVWIIPNIQGNYNEYCQKKSCVAEILESKVSFLTVMSTPHDERLYLLI